MDIEEFIAKHRPSRYSSFGDNMDLYITDSLQDMLDMDIKSEMATDLGSTTDFSDTLGLSFTDMPPLLDIDSENATSWTTSTNSSFVHNLDLYGSEANAVMVNPNSVMPSMFSETKAKSELMNFIKDDSPPGSPRPDGSHLTFSPSTIKIPKYKEEFAEESVEPSKLIKEEQSPMVIYVRKDSSLIKKDILSEMDTKRVKIAPSSLHNAPLRIKKAPEMIKIGNKSCSILNSNQKLTNGQLSGKTIISGNIHIIGAQQSRTILANAAKNQATILIDNGTMNSKGQLIKTTVGSAFTLENSQAKYMHTNNNKYSNNTNEFPKPAYSYSCLIAMALKNSRTGSLPVSEIYNFMCQHFPYFKTAPNGWKNSVRHNLSLNKCFEKIEKPSTNGGQRKGCLWAMNPAKIGKMDEEVLKWSRKDPQGIKKAMVCPETLEALERGEMKYSSSGVSDQELTDGDDGEVEHDLDTDADPDTEGQESDQELEVEEVVNVDGSYRLLTNAHADFVTSSEEMSDVEVESAFDDLDMSRPFQVDVALSDSDDELPSKKTKTSFIYEPVMKTQSHTNRRKTPLVNRIA